MFLRATTGLRDTLVGIAGMLIAAFAVFVAVAWWGSRLPARPAGISVAGIFIERGAVPFKLSTHGNWLDCWQDPNNNADHCKLTDEKGAVQFEDVFLPYAGSTAVPGSDLAIDARETGHLKFGVPNVSVSVPVVFLRNGQILLPRTGYAQGKSMVDARQEAIKMLKDLHPGTHE